MKRFIAPSTPVVIALTLALITVACAGIGSFSFTEESDVIVVESTLVNGLLPTRVPMQIDLEQELQEQDASGAKSVYLTELYFEMTDDTDEDDFSAFLDDIVIEVSSDSHDTKEIAWSDPVPTSEGRLELNVDDDLDIKPHAEEGLRFRTNANGSAPPEDAKFRVYATFRVRVL